MRWCRRIADGPQLDGPLALAIIDGSLEAVTGNAVALDTSRADAAVLRIGSSVEIQTPGGVVRSLDVAGLYRSVPGSPQVWSPRSAQHGCLS